MQKITISLPARTRSYPVIIGSGLLGNLPAHHDLSAYSKIFVVTDKNLEKLWLEKLLVSLPVDSPQLALESGEQAKDADSLQAIWKALHQAGCDRHSLVIALGGGVIGDMAGLAAATYMRGVPCLHVPTTILSMVDSSLGGKTGIDFDRVKNLIGTFTQPSAVISDIELLSTLPQREFVAGFGEIIKHGLILDAEYLQLVTSKPPLEFTTEELEEVIAGSCRIKANVVENDETESGLRKALNFGHTIGHAIEALSLETADPLLHGECVAIGMVVESQLAVAQGLLPAEAAAEIKRFLQTAQLPVTSPNFDIPAILSKLQSDKKNAHGNIRFTLLRSLGQAIWDQEVSEEVIVSSLQRNMETSTP